MKLRNWVYLIGINLALVILISNGWLGIVFSAVGYGLCFWLGYTMRSEVVNNSKDREEEYGN